MRETVDQPTDNARHIDEHEERRMRRLNVADTLQRTCPQQAPADRKWTSWTPQDRSRVSAIGAAGLATTDAPCTTAPRTAEAPSDRARCGHDLIRINRTAALASSMPVCTGPPVAPELEPGPRCERADACWSRPFWECA